MLHFHEHHEYLTRAIGAWACMREPGALWADPRDIDAGYCLDALERGPAGATRRIEPQWRAPFAAPAHTLFR